MKKLTEKEIQQMTNYFENMVRGINNKAIENPTNFEQKVFKYFSDIITIINLSENSNKKVLILDPNKCEKSELDKIGFSTFNNCFTEL